MGLAPSEPHYKEGARYGTHQGLHAVDELLRELAGALLLVARRRGRIRVALAIISSLTGSRSQGTYATASCGRNSGVPCSREAIRAVSVCVL